MRKNFEIPLPFWRVVGPNQAGEPAFLQSSRHDGDLLIPRGLPALPGAGLARVSGPDW